MADSITKPELNSMAYLIRIAEYDPLLARLVLRQPFMEHPFQHRDALALMGLAEMTIVSPDAAATLAAQPWFEDGVDDLEAALLKVLGFDITADFRRALIETHYISSAPVRLPLTGDVDLIVIRHTPFPHDDSTLVAMEEGVRAIEDFMDAPYPINDFILLVVDPDIWERRAVGSIVGGYEPGLYAQHILVKDRRVILGEERYKGVIYHELSHLHLFYAYSSPRWLSEGSAQFFAAYTRDKLGRVNIEQWLAYLESPEGRSHETNCDKQNLQQHMDDYKPDNCDYYLGELFLLAMYTILGEEGVSAALRDLHSHVIDTRSSPHEDLIYQTFAKYTPSGKNEEFQAAYRRYHGGPIIALAPPAEDRRTALAALYHATQGSSWAISDNWLSDMPLGAWYGVTDAAGGQVTGLALGYNDLNGEIPAELGNLTNLVQLDLSTNELTGTIPSELGRLRKLKVLNLGDTQLAGEIPVELGSLTELEDLFLGGSPLTGTIPPELGGLAKLGRLYLTVAQLSGEIPVELSHLTNLRGLDLSTNQLSGKIPPELGSLSSELWRLDLSENLLTGEISPELANLTGLGFLNLSGNHLVGEIPPELGSFPDLTRALDLSRNRLDGEIPSGLGRLIEVGRLNLSENQLTGKIPPELGGLAKLGVLDLSENQLSGEIPPELGRLNQLWRAAPVGEPSGWKDTAGTRRTHRAKNTKCQSESADRRNTCISGQSSQFARVVPQRKPIHRVRAQTTA